MFRFSSIRSLCPPALVYLMASLFVMFMVVAQNLNNSNSVRIGTMFSCRVPSTVLVCLMKLAYIGFWTYMLNLICRDGHVGLSWFLVFLPWIVVGLMTLLLMINM
jgi:hypothetical protein